MRIFLKASIFVLTFLAGLFITWLAHSFPGLAGEQPTSSQEPSPIQNELVANQTADGSVEVRFDRITREYGVRTAVFTITNNSAATVYYYAYEAGEHPIYQMRTGQFLEAPVLFCGTGLVQRKLLPGKTIEGKFSSWRFGDFLKNHKAKTGQVGFKLYLTPERDDSSSRTNNEGVIFWTEPLTPNSLANR